MGKWRELASSENLLALASLYGVLWTAGQRKSRTGPFCTKSDAAGNYLPGRGAECLHSADAAVEYGLPAAVILAVKLIPLAACSIWMAFNLNYEKDLAQRRKTTGSDCVTACFRL